MSSMDENEIEIEVPHFFLCPISLEMMKDPVTVPTGITYDRESIEKWLFSGKNNTCPVTKQLISGSELTPNHTLRRLIQSWCIINASHGIERFPTPKPPVSKSMIEKLIKTAKSQQSQMMCLKELKSMASMSEANRRCIEAAGAIEFLASIIQTDALDHDEFWTRTTGDEALIVLHSLHLSDAGLRSLIADNGIFIESLTRIMRSGSYESRAYAISILKSVVEVADAVQLMNLSRDLFIELVQLLRDQISWKASKAALQVLSNVLELGRNKIKAAEAGAVPVLVDLLLDLSEKRACEMILIVLDNLCQSAEGRAELIKHRAGLAVVSKKILRVSKVASERAVRVLHSIARISATPSVLEEMMQVGVVVKLCLVIQVDSGTKTKERAREILKMHARVWKNSPCMPVTFLSSYPF